MLKGRVLNKPQIDLSLYLVTDRILAKGRDLVQIVKQAVEGGVSTVQLREKEISSKMFFELAVEIKQLLKPYSVPLIINDRLDIALAVEAEGLHIGQNDLPYAQARKILGPNKIIGLSVETVQQAYLANEIDVDYIGLSPVFSTDTKADISTPLGLEGVADISKITKHKTVAIGGVHSGNAANILKAGANGIAVVSAIVAQKEPKLAAQKLKRIVTAQ